MTKQWWNGELVWPEWIEYDENWIGCIDEIKRGVDYGDMTWECISEVSQEQNTCC